MPGEVYDADCMASVSKNSHGGKDRSIPALPPPLECFSGVGYAVKKTSFKRVEERRKYEYDTSSSFSACPRRAAARLFLKQF